MGSILAKEKGMFVSKSVRNSTITAFLAFGLAACSDGLTAPQSSGFDPGEALMAKGGPSGSGSENTGRGRDEGSRTFTIHPRFPVFERFGDHILTMPANAVCDPATSGYGAAHWDEPCARASEPIRVTAKWAVRGGRPVISFSPDLRFAPSDNRFQWVQLSMWDRRGVHPELYYAILWYDAEANRWVDESQADPTLAARPVFDGALVRRRLKHFSDYALWAGLGSYNVTSGMGGDIIGLGGW